MFVFIFSVCNFLPLFFLNIVSVSVIMTMANRNITLIKDLDNMRDDYTLKVCIIWLWRSISEVNPTIVKSFEMILMDEMVKYPIPISLFKIILGTKIQASVYPSDFQRFESNLKEDKLNLHGRITVHECLSFQSKTTFEFSCVSFESIIYATATSNNSIGHFPPI
uniref:Uncharacterized protein n=1 Tax=Lactuca sativa TaxID=4236 RepID=A0A9R1XGN6_LACSA|nr:hypothetical protein LSAT_V11C400208320 [Lactuca sativa]